MKATFSGDQPLSVVKWAAVRPVVPVAEAVTARTVSCRRLPWLTFGSEQSATPLSFRSSSMLIRGELAYPGLQFLSQEQYNQLFTMHGTVMLLLFATPIVFGFANVVLPLQIGAPDVAFPRLNALSFWVFLFGGLIVLSGFLLPDGAADFGWTAYAPLSRGMFSQGPGGDVWITGLIVSGRGTILGAVNMITTVVCLRAPGMTMFRIPIFTWNIFVTSIMILIAFPILTSALFGLLADRQLGAHVFDPANGGPILYQHLFWFFGHPEVYIVAVPFFGIVTEIFLPGVQPQTAVRLRWHGLRDVVHQRTIHSGVGAPHVRDRRSSAARRCPSCTTCSRARGTGCSSTSTIRGGGGHGNSLEWATTCQPPRHNFTELPRIRSERPAFELHYPHMTERMRPLQPAREGERRSGDQSGSQGVPILVRGDMYRVAVGVADVAAAQPFAQRVFVAGVAGALAAVGVGPGTRTSRESASRYSSRSSGYAGSSGT